MFFVTLSLVGALGTAVVYLVGGSIALNGSLEAGDVVAFAALVTQAYHRSPRSPTRRSRC